MTILHRHDPHNTESASKVHVYAGKTAYSLRIKIYIEQPKFFSEPSLLKFPQKRFFQYMYMASLQISLEIVGCCGRAV